MPLFYCCFIFLKFILFHIHFQYHFQYHVHGGNHLKVKFSPHPFVNLLNLVVKMSLSLMLCFHLTLLCLNLLYFHLILGRCLVKRSAKRDTYLVLLPSYSSSSYSFFILFFILFFFILFFSILFFSILFSLCFFILYTPIIIFSNTYSS